MVSSSSWRALIIALLLTTEITCDWRQNQPSYNQTDQVEVFDSGKCFCCSKNCLFQRDSGTLICNGIRKFGDDYLRRCSGIIVHLKIVKSSAKSINQLGLINSDVTFPNLESISLRNSSIEQVMRLPGETQLRRIELCHNVNLTYISWQMFKDTEKLSYLDVSHNKLDSIEKMDVFTKLTGLNLSGNEWSCGIDFSWLVELHHARALVNGDDLLCHDNSRKNISWIKWSYSVLKREKTKRIVQAECKQRTANCSCQFTTEGREGRGSYKVQVDCSGKNLTALPDELPSNTNELDVSRNLLTNLNKVNQYDLQPLRILIADSNQIRSIMDLSKSVFMRNFSRFSLQHNSISHHEIPLAELTQVSSEFQVKYVYLHDNGWECDCLMAKDIRKWLLQHRNIVNDSYLLMCSRESKKIPVLNLLPETICETWTDEINGKEGHREYTIRTFQGIICLEVVLIALVVIKLTYDSWRYLCHGELPWMASKLF